MAHRSSLCFTRGGRPGAYAANVVRMHLGDLYFMVSEWVALGAGIIWAHLFAFLAFMSGSTLVVDLLVAGALGDNFDF